MRVDELRRLALFRGTDDEQLEALLAEGTEVAFEAGQELWTAGQRMASWWVLLAGRIDLVRRTTREEAVLSTMDTPGQWVGAVGAWDERAVYFLTGRAAGAGRLLRIPTRALRTLSSARFPLGDQVVEGVVTSLRRVEATVRDKEALVALGTLAAGLAHELNNPAAAATRAVDALGDQSSAMLSALRRLSAASAVEDRLRTLDAFLQELGPPDPSADPMVVADLEESLSAALSGHGVQRPWDLASVLAGAGADAGWCDRLAAALGDLAEPGLEWVVGALSAAQYQREAKDAARRITDLVAAVRSYTQLDRAAIQPVDVVGGLESTLAVLAHRFPVGVTVVRDHGEGLPQIEAAAAELNQVWSALVENALDAMGNQGTLRVRTRAEVGGGVLVEIEDTGPGMPPEVQHHAFDPFFTTKGVGRGAGLGLDTARRIVERHGGEIAIESRPGGTVLRVRLPAGGAAGR